MLKIVLTGGGTGGHIYPALAIGEYLKKEKGADLFYIGTKKGLESQILQNTMIPFKTVHAEGLSRKLSLKTLKALFLTGIGTLEALWHLIKYRPNIVIGTGGFVCAPTILAARLLGIPCFLHEQNAYPGLTNRLLASSCKVVMTSFLGVEKYLSKKAKVIETGLPIRGDILEIDKKEALKRFNLSEGKMTLLVTGGSRGAKSINEAVIGFLPKFLEDDNRQMIFATGKNNYNEVISQINALNLKDDLKKRLIVKAYLHDMPYALAASDVVLSRAGATFLAEITSLGLTGVLVPYPFASENHQMHNAKAIVEAGGAEMLLDEALNSKALMEKVLPFFENEAYYHEKREGLKALSHQNVLEKITEVVMDYQKKSR